MTALSEFATLKRLPMEYLQGHGFAEDKGGIAISYGESARARLRKHPGSAHPTYWAKGDARPMRVFGNDLVPKLAAGPSKSLFIAEGESDTATFWWHRRAALGVPGSTMSHVLAWEDVVWADRIVIIREPGEAGAKFVVGVAKRLRDLGFGGEIVQASLDPYKDPSDLHIAVNGDKAKFAALLDDAIGKSTPVAVESQPSALPSEILSAADLLSSPIEQIEYLIDGHLPKGGIAMYIGKPKSGKTSAARNAALSVCRGEPFIGCHTEKTVVLWLALEETRAQVTTAFRAMGLREDDPIHFFFGHVAHEAQAWLERACERVKVGLVVIDTWHKLTMIENVNDYGAVNRANQRLQALARERGVAQIWIHHSNKSVARNGSEVLGSQALFAAVDTLLSIDRAEDGTRTIWTIQRTGEDLEPTVVTMNDDGLISVAGSKRDLEVTRAQKRILEALSDEPMLTKDLRDAAGIRRTLFWSALNSLVRSGDIRRTGEGKNVDPYRYSRGNHQPNSSSVVPLVPKNYKEPPEPGSHSSGTTSEPPGTTGTGGTTGTIGTTRDDQDLLEYASEVFGDDQ